MKFGLNRINITLFTQQMGWLGGKNMNSIFGVQGSNFRNDISCGQHHNIGRIFHTYLNYLR